MAATAAQHHSLQRVRLNLAPEVYQAAQRSKHRRALAISAAVTISLIAIGIVVVELITLGGQAVLINSLNSQIKEKQGKISAIADLPAAVTAQQNLTTLAALQSQKVYISRFFEELQKLAPQGISVSSVSITPDNQIQVSASAKSYSLVTKFTKALEASNVTVGTGAAATQQPYFSDVVLSGVSNNNGSVDFQLTAQMSPEVTGGN